MDIYTCKAKTLYDRKWVTGYYLQGKYYFDDEPMHFIFLSDEVTVFPRSEFTDANEVDPKTLCRYTGVNDQHGNPIFENDILKVCLCYSDWSDCNEIFIDSIMFENGCFCFNNVFSSDGYNELSCVYNEITCGDGIYDGCIFEVIGNKFDNTELMEVRNNELD